MNPSTPRVSVLIPTYNRAALLCEAIESVLAQTYDDFEIIVVDDGSTDDTAKVVLAYGARIRYFRCDHGGPATARNIGMQLARGDYLCLLDSDDLYYPHKLALQVDHLDRNPDTVMVYTDFSAFDDAGYGEEFHLKTYHASAYRNPQCAYDRMFAERRALSDNSVIRDAARSTGSSHWSDRNEYRGELFDAYLHNTVVFTNSMMFRRGALASAGLQDSWFGHFHDLEFALRLCRLGKVAFIDNPTYKLRYHPGQVSSTSGSGRDSTAIALQRGLLRVARRHASVGEYYERNRACADALVAHRCRAVAVPMIAYGGSSAHLRRCLPSRARVYLRHAAQRGHPDAGLYLASYLPELARRLYFRMSRWWRQRMGAAGQSR